MKQIDLVNLTFLEVRNEHLRDKDESLHSSKDRQSVLLRSTFIFFSYVILMCLGKSVYGQTMKVYPLSVDVQITECNGSVSKTFNIENNGADVLNYSLSAISDADGNRVGQIISTHPNFSFTNGGIAQVENYFFVINWDENLLEKYDTITKTIIATYSIPEGSSGIAFDGEYLWIGSYFGTIQKYDLSGNKAGPNINLPFAFNSPAVAYDGKYLIVAPCYISNPTIYKIEKTGNIVETYTSDISNIYQFTYVPEHGSGCLWIKNGYEYLMKVNLSKGVAQIEDVFDFEGDYYSMTHDGTDLWIGQWGSLERVDDGIDETINYLTFSDNNGTVNPGTEKTITANFKGNGLKAGYYSGKIEVISDDAEKCKIDYTLDLEGNPELVFSKPLLNFGSLPENGSITDTLWMFNQGCDVLNVNEITSSSTDFSLDVSSIDILPFNSAPVVITFNPQEVKNYVDTLSIFNNIGKNIVLLNGSGIEPPVLSLSTDLISDTLNGCGNSTSNTFKISNSGQSPLVFDIVSLRESDLYFESNKYYTTSGATTKHIFNDFNVEIGELSISVTINGDYTDDGEFASLIIEGEDFGQINPLYIGDDIDFTRIYTFSGTKVSKWLEDGKLSIDVVNAPDVDNGWAEDRHTVEVNCFMNGVFVISPLSGSIPPGSSSEINVTFNSDGKSSGVHNSSIIVNTNDPYNTSGIVMCSYTVDGESELSLSASTINFVKAIKNESNIDTLVLKNNGCDTIEIIEISGKNAEFTTDISSSDILPYCQSNLILTFSSAITGSYKDTLVIISSVSQDTVILSGVITEPPVMLVSDKFISVVTTECKSSITKSFSIKNVNIAGNADLKYSISQDFFEPVEYSDEIWETELYNSTDDLWHKSDLASFSGDSSWWCGLESTGDFETGNRINTALISPTIDLKNAKSSVIQFMEKFETEDGYDYCMVDVSTDDGENWSQLRGEGLSGSSGGWVATSFDLTAYCGKLIKIRFYFDTRDGAYNNFSGWFIDDIKITGAEDSRLNISEKDGTVSSGDSITLNLDINDLGTETYFNTLYINSNDPLNSIDTLFLEFSVDGSPVLNLPAKMYDFGSEVAGGKSIESINISNSGCKTLEISNIICSSSVFSVFDTEKTILPKDTAQVKVFFSPLSVGTYIDTLVITSNVENDTVILKGIAIEPPVLSVNIDSLRDTVICGGSVVRSYTITNSGTTDLVVSEKIIANKPSLTAGENLGFYTGFYNYTGMVKVGKYIYRNNYNDNTIEKYDLVKQNVVASYPIEYGYLCGITYDGEFLWVVISDGTVHGFDLSGNEVGISFNLPFNSCGTITYDGQYFIVAENYTSATTFYRIDHSGSVIESYTSDITNLYCITWVPEHESGNLWTAIENGNLFQLNLHKGIASQVNNFFLDEEYIYNLIHDGTDFLYAGWNGPMIRFDDGIIENGGWIELSNDSSTIKPGASSTVDIKLSAENLVKGTYQGKIIISSNDPSNTQDTIVCNFVQEGKPTMELSRSVVNFPGVFINANSQGSFIMSNNGCDVLEISNVASSESDFTLSETAFDIMPGESKKVSVTFTPSVAGIIEGSLLISNNLKDTVIELIGTGIIPTVLSVTTNTSDGYYNEGDIIDMIVSFNNEMLTDITNGTPQIKLNTTPVAYANYVSGSGSRELVFNYTVGANDNTLALDYSDTKAFTLEGGIITDNLLNNADTTLPEVGSFAGAHKIVIDNVHPKVMISTSVGSPTPQNPILIKIEFDEEVSGLALSDFSVTNGTVTNLISMGDNLNWTVQIIPSADDTIPVILTENSVEDIAGNGNVASDTFAIVYDSTLPLILLTSSSSEITNDNPIVITVISNVPVSGLELSDIVVTNGTASNLTNITDSIKWTADVTPAADGKVTVEIPVGSVENKGNHTNPEGSDISFVYDGTEPVVILSSISKNPTNVTPIVVDIDFSEKVTGFTLSDLIVVNGSASNLQGIGDTTWTVDITPSANGEVTVDIPAGTATDLVGNGNIAASRFSVIYDNVSPAVTLSSVFTGTVNVSPIAVTITFTEEVRGFSIADLTVGNGSASNLISVDSIVWVADITPAANGAVTVDIAADVANDITGNKNTAATQFSVIYDNVVPGVTITSTLVSPVKVSPVPVSITFTEEVSGFSISDITVGNGSAYNLQTNDNVTWTVNILPAANGTVTVNVPAAAAYDLAGNYCTAASFSFTYDNTSGIEPDASISEISIYPNPVKDNLQISLTNAETEARYCLYSILGNTLSEGPIENGMIMLNMEGYAKGIYTIRITAGENQQEFKIVKE